MKILVLNSGSSSLKYQLFDMTNENVIAKGNCERIGEEKSFITLKVNGIEKVIDTTIPNHNEAINQMLKILTDGEIGVIKSLNEIAGVGHRVVHGGLRDKSQLATAEVLADLEKITDLAPLHNPANLGGVRACQKVMQGVPNVLVYDTAFHATIPEEAFMYAIDYADYEKYGIRRYGFHGTSHKFVAEEAAKMLNKNLQDLKIITLHIGNGASATAVSGGKSVDTSMGFTPLEGLIMGTRSGDIDASVVSFLAEKKGMSAAQVTNYLNKKCGLLGVSGRSNDFRELNKLIDAGDKKSKLALMMDAYRVRKYIGSFAAAMGGLDAIVFTGGVGENQENLREFALENLEFLGIQLDVKKNWEIPRNTNEIISKESSKVKILRIPTNEELVIARDTFKIIKK